MNRDYLLLGVRENASKEQIQKAYERRLLKYKSPDYDDDPEYVRRRIDELNAAYNRVYKAAETASGSLKREVRAVESGYEKRSIKGKERETVHSQKRVNYEKKRREIEGEELHLFDRLRRTNQGAESGDKNKKVLNKPDFTSLKNKANDLKTRVTESINDGNAMSVQEATVKSETADTLNGPAAEKNEENQAKVFLSVISVIISLVVGFCTMCDSSDDIYIGDVEDDYSYVYELSDYSDSDRAVYDEAQQVYTSLYEMELADHWLETTVSEAELEMTANAFTKAYTEDLNLSALCERLYQHYDQFTASGSDDVSYQIEEVLRFYGFPDYYEIEGRINPYNEEVIDNMCKYLHYLIQYHDNFSDLQENEQAM